MFKVLRDFAFVRIVFLYDRYVDWPRSEDLSALATRVASSPICHAVAFNSAQVSKRQTSSPDHSLIFNVQLARADSEWKRSRGEETSRICGTPPGTVDGHLIDKRPPRRSATN